MIKQVVLAVFIILIQKVGFSQNKVTVDSLLKVHSLNGFNGNVLYSRNDSIIFKGNYGYANIEKQTLLTDSSIFDLASLSKQFTAVCIIQLIERGLISFQTTMDSIWPNLPYKGITIEHLLRHQSGLPDYMDLLSSKKYWNRKKIAINKDILSIMAQNSIPAEFSPGTKSVYSNTGYAVLASIIEEISGLEYEQYLENNIFSQIGMSKSKVVRRIYKPDTDPNLTIGYYRKGKRNMPNYLLDEKMKYLDGIVGDGMVHSTILDLLTWKKALKRNLLITEQNKNKMFSGDSISNSIGCGFVVQNSEKFGKYVLHSGAWQGYVTFLVYVINTDEFVTILSNNSYEEYAEINTLLLKYCR